MKRIIAFAAAFVMTASSAFAAFDRSALEAEYDELENLINRCEERGINVGAERVSAAVLKKFIAGVEHDAELDAGLKSEGYSLIGLTGRDVDASVEKLNSLYREAKTNLEAYLDGSKKTNSVNFGYKTGKEELDKDGLQVDGAPFFSVGYGHFSTAENDIPIFSDLGADNIQIEVGPSSVLQKADATAKTYTYEGTARDKAAAEINDTLKKAEENNVGVNLLLSPHYMPAWCSEWYPEIKGGAFGWCKYNIFSDKAKQLISDYLKGLLPKIEDSKALTSVILSNEPSCITYLYPDLFSLDYRLYLAGKYKTIGTLNEKWGTAYTKFNEIQMPSYDSGTNLPTSYDANFYDWYNYNEDKFSAWHEWMAGEVRKYLPNVKISVKVLDYFWTDDTDDTLRLRGISGNDAEKLAKFCDYAGCDAYGLFENHEEIVGKYMWYDYLRSVTGQPIYNSENHIFYDDYKKFEESAPTQPAHAAMDVWQGAIHGCEKTTYWTWERLDYKKGADGNTWYEAVQRELKTPYAASLLHRPLVVDAIGKQSLNLNRLSDEVRMLENAENKTALLYSKTARIYNKSHMERLYYTYREMISAGFGADFVTENNPERMNDYDTVILPEVNNIEANTLKCLYEFVQNGGRVVLVFSSLGNNEYNNPSDEQQLSYILQNAYQANIPNLKETLYGIDKRGLKMELKSSKTGKYVSGADFKWTENKDGSVLINMCNLTVNDMKNLTLYKDGVPVSGTNLISGEAVGEVFDLKKYEPILLYIPGNGGYAENISVDSENNIKWKRGLFPVYVSEITDGIENKSFYAIAQGGVKAAAGGIYYLQNTDGEKAYPGKILSLQQGKLFEIAETDAGYELTNVSNAYAAGVLVLEYDGAKIIRNVYLSPGESKIINVEKAISAVIYNNMFQKRRID